MKTLANLSITLLFIYSVLSANLDDSVSVDALEAKKVGKKEPPEDLFANMQNEIEEVKKVYEQEKDDERQKMKEEHRLQEVKPNFKEAAETPPEQPVQSTDNISQMSVDTEKSQNDTTEVLEKDEEYINAHGERIPARPYLNKIRAQGKPDSATGTLVLEDPSSLLMANYLSKSDSWTLLSDLNDDDKNLLITQHPLFKAAAKLDPRKVFFQVVPGGSHERDLLRLDPLTGIVYRTCRISLKTGSEGEAFDMLQEAKFVLVLTTKIEEIGDGSVNVWVKVVSTEPFIPFQQRISLAAHLNSSRATDWAGINVPGEIFAQPFQPGHFLVPVLARHDLPESSPENRNIYISIEEYTRTNTNYAYDPADHNPLSQSTLCVWILQGGPGTKVGETRQFAKDTMLKELFIEPTGMVKANVILVEHRGLGQAHRLAPSRRLSSQNPNDPWSTAMIDLPINQ